MPAILRKKLYMAKTKCGRSIAEVGGVTKGAARQRLQEMAEQSSRRSFQEAVRDWERDGMLLENRGYVPEFGRTG